MSRRKAESTEERDMTEHEAQHIDRLISNARTLAHQTQVVAQAAAVMRLGGVSSECVWCAESRGWGVAEHRLAAGGDCDCCSYSGRDCLVVVR